MSPTKQMLLHENMQTLSDFYHQILKRAIEYDVSEEDYLRMEQLEQDIRALTKYLEVNYVL